MPGTAGRSEPTIQRHVEPSSHSCCKASSHSDCMMYVHVRCPGLGEVLEVPAASGLSNVIVAILLAHPQVLYQILSCTLGLVLDSSSSCQDGAVLSAASGYKLSIVSIRLITKVAKLSNSRLESPLSRQGSSFPHFSSCVERFGQSEDMQNVHLRRSKRVVA